MRDRSAAVEINGTRVLRIAPRSSDSRLQADGAADCEAGSTGRIGKPLGPAEFVGWSETVYFDVRSAAFF